MKKENGTEEAKQVGKFGLVGIINTLLDLGILNILTRFFGVQKALANIISVSVAIINSYILNKTWTFKNKEKKWAQQFIIFVLLSLVGMAINTGILIFLTERWTTIPNFFYSIVEFLNIDKIFDKEFVVLNSAKVFAIAGSMVWNYITYKKFAFNDQEKK